MLLLLCTTAALCCGYPYISINSHCLHSKSFDNVFCAQVHSLFSFLGCPIQKAATLKPVFQAPLIICSKSVRSRLMLFFRSSVQMQITCGNLFAVCTCFCYDTSKLEGRVHFFCRGRVSVIILLHFPPSIISNIVSLIVDIFSKCIMWSRVAQSIKELLALVGFWLFWVLD